MRYVGPTTHSTMSRSYPIGGGNPHPKALSKVKTLDMLGIDLIDPRHLLMINTMFVGTTCHVSDKAHQTTVFHT